MKDFKLFTEPLMLSLPVFCILKIGVTQVETDIVLFGIFLPFQFRTNFSFNLCLAHFQAVKVRFSVIACHRETDTDIFFSLLAQVWISKPERPILNPIQHWD